MLLISKVVMIGSGDFESARIIYQVLHGEAENADESSIAPFYEKLRKLINNEELLLSLVYDADKTGMFWQALPKNTRV